MKTTRSPDAGGHPFRIDYSMRLAVLMTLALGVTACGATRGSLAADGSPASVFDQRVADYLKLRQRALGDLAAAAVTADPVAITGREHTAAQRIRSARSDAHPGDLFAPPVRDYIRERLRHVAASDLTGAVDVVHDVAPQPGVVPVEVNGTYPATEPRPRMPAAILDVLPPIARPLEYRIIGRTLLLIDQPANLIVDFISDAL